MLFIIDPFTATWPRLRLRLAYVLVTSFPPPVAAHFRQCSAAVTQRLQTMQKGSAAPRSALEQSQASLRASSGGRLSIRRAGAHSFSNVAPRHLSTRRIVSAGVLTLYSPAAPAGSRGPPDLARWRRRPRLLPFSSGYKAGAHSATAYAADVSPRCGADVPAAADRAKPPVPFKRDITLDR